MNVKFYVHKDGYLLSTGYCPEAYVHLQAREGEEVGIGDPPEWLKPRPVDLDIYKAQAKGEIDTFAGAARSRYITIAPGQEATYQLKANEAEAYVAAGRPEDTTDYPLLTAEANMRGVMVSELADMILSIRAQWVQKAAAIETIRLSGKLAVDAATTHEEVDQAKQTVLDQLRAV